MLVFDVPAFSMSSTRDFDPRTRAFSDEELKPQPMIKKSRKQFVPDEMKDDKYWARRRKNNMAAKRSRDARRMKENQIALRAGYLEKEVRGRPSGVDRIVRTASGVQQFWFVVPFLSVEHEPTSRGGAAEAGEHGTSCPPVQVPGGIILAYRE